MTCVRVCEGEREGEGVRMWVAGGEGDRVRG